MVVIVRYAFGIAEERPPSSCGAVKHADSITGSEPQVTLTVPNDIMHLVISQRTAITVRVLEPFVTPITVIAYSDTSRIVGHPYTAILIHIYIVDVVSVHSVVAAVIGGNIWLGTQ